MDEYPAHIRIDSPGQETEQSVAEHCRKTAAYASAALASIGLSKSGYLAGLLHDIVKAKAEFTVYIRRAAHGFPVSRGTVNHTFAGVRFLMERYHAGTLSFRDIVCELLALAAGSHHGLFDCVNEDGDSGFLYRRTKPDIGYVEARENYLRDCADESEIDEYFHAAEAELTPLLHHICTDMVDETASNERFDEETSFYAGLLSRMLLSAVIEGDRRDTAAFMDGTHFPTDRTQEEMKELWETCLQRVERRLQDFPQENEINCARSAISDTCKMAASLPGGLYRLNVPTGAGKTLSFLRYALAHAAKYHKKRILYVAPLISILEQNAKVIRSGVNADDLILEHHSNLVQTEETQEELDRRELLSENWDAPIIITTLVQLLNTLFSGKTSCIRRFHALCESVILIDEVQTVPTHMLSLFTLAVNFLTDICGATVVLCSATQPCMEQIGHPLHAAKDLVPFNPVLWEAFRRTRIQDLGDCSLEDIAAYAKKELNRIDSLLVVCNKKDEVAQLFAELKHCGGQVFALSAAMCMKHRRDVLEKMETAMKTPGEKVLCIASQVIEAGVDISFQCVIRLAAGMDNVIQAAGRCNRNGEAGKDAPVYIARCREENLTRLPDMQAGKEATLALLTEFANHPERYRGTLDSDEAIRDYYGTLYRRMPKTHQDYPVKKKPYTLLSLGARNAWMECRSGENYYFRQAFRLAGSLFEVFPQDTTDIIVSHEEGKDIITELNSRRAEHDADYLRTLLKRAEPYSVSLYAYQVEALRKEGALHLTKSGAWTLDGHYDTDTGFTMEQTQPLELLEV